MKLNMNLRPTLVLEREASLAYQVVLALFIVLPAIALLSLAYRYYGLRTELADINAASLKSAASMRSINGQKSKKGLKKVEKNKLLAQMELLKKVYAERLPKSALVLAGIEKSLVSQARLTELKMESSSTGFKLRLKGKTNSPDGLPDIIENLQKQLNCIVRLNSVIKGEKTDNWSFELETYCSVPQSLLSTTIEGTEP